MGGLLVLAPCSSFSFGRWKPSALFFTRLEKGWGIGTLEGPAVWGGA